MGKMTQKYLTAKAFCLTSAFWMVVATSMGLLGATELIAPDLTENISWLVFGRVRPIHVNLVLFGFVTPGLLSAAFYYVPRLLRTELYSEKLGFITALAWNATLVFAVVSLALGYSQGREYAEMIWPVDIMVVLAFSLVFVNLIMTVARRKGTDPLCFHLVRMCGCCADNRYVCPWKCHMATQQRFFGGYSGCDSSLVLRP